MYMYVSHVSIRLVHMGLGHSTNSALNAHNMCFSVGHIFYVRSIGNCMYTYIFVCVHWHMSLITLAGGAQGV